jgi:hypothetical protein
MVHVKASCLCAVLLVIMLLFGCPGPVDGDPQGKDGSLLVEILWPSWALLHPQVESTLLDGSGSEKRFVFTVTGNVAVASRKLPAGYYDLMLRLRDGTSLAWGTYEAVRILPDQASSVTYVFSELAGQSGEAELHTDDDLHKPWVISIRDCSSELEQGSSMTVRASVTAPVVPESYQWFFDGMPSAGSTSSSVTIGDVEPGSHTLSVRGVHKGTVSSGSVLFRVVESGSAAGRWARSVSTGSGNSQFYSVATDDVGNIYAAGSQGGTGTYTYGRGVSAYGTCAGENATLVKYGPSGAAQWAQTIRVTDRATESALFRAVAVDLDGNIYAAGYQYGTERYAYGPNASAAGSAGGRNAVLVKYNSTGIAQWARTVDEGWYSSYFNAVAVDRDGNIYVAGYQNGTGSCTYGPNVTVTGATPYDNALLVKYDPSGKPQWARTILVGDDQSIFRSVAVDTEGNVFAAGFQYGLGSFSYGTGVTAEGKSLYENIVVVTIRSFR